MKKKQGSQTKQRTELGVLGLILALVIMGAIGRFLQDATGYPYGWFGMFWWTTAVFVPFLLGLLYFAMFVLPTPGMEGWAEGLRLLWRNYLSPPRRPDPTQSAAKKKKGETAVAPHLADLPPSFTSLRCGLTRSHQALALVKGARFSRAAGPGFITLYKGESVAQVVDLRRQTRLETVKANTRDGIPIECPVSVTFRIWQQEQSTDALAYPYDPDAIFQVNYTNSVDPGNNLRRWSTQVAPQAAALFVLEIAQSSLDELFQVDENGLGTIHEIRQRIKRNLERSDSLAGVEVLSVGTGKFTLHDSVLEQRMKQWQARWQHEIKVRRATGDAEMERRMRQARARAQIEIIDKITQNIIEMRRADGVNLTDVITLRMIEALEEAASKSSVKALLPPPILSGVVDSSRTMRLWVEGQEEPQP